MTTDSGTILVVDDNEMNRDMLSRRLRKLGYDAEVAEDGTIALEKIRKHKYDLILLDIMMPVVSGLDVLKTIREKYTLSDLPVIMVTAKDQPEDLVEAFKLGANDYITKPVDFPVAKARIMTHMKLRNLTRLKDEFLAIASHDLKNPLTGILGMAGLLKIIGDKHQPMGDKEKEMLTRIEELSWVMNRIITDFLDFQAMDDGQLKMEFKPTDINQLVKTVELNNRDYALKKKITLELDLDPEIPTLAVDPARIQQVIENLVGNAIKFSKMEAKTILRTRSRDNYIYVEVEDTGPGLTEEDQKQLFMKYARLSNRPTGGEKSSGLGLAICRKIIEIHHGEIAARNNPIAGATFWFMLPVIPAVRTATTENDTE